MYNWFVVGCKYIWDWMGVLWIISIWEINIMLNLIKGVNFKGMLKIRRIF